MIINPLPGTAWAHSATPVWNKDKTRAELWHTRLEVLETKRRNQSADERKTQGPLVRASNWFSDVESFSLPINESQREKIVKSKPFQVNRLMLSSLGAWLDVNQRWDDVDGKPPPLEEWQHRMTLGRDHYVRVVEPGYLFPFGHRASLITITERKFQDHENGRGAFLRQHKYVMVREPRRSYALADFPFMSVRIRTLVTPNLAPPSQSSIQDVDAKGNPYSFGEDAFFPRILLTGGNGEPQITDFLFACEARDKEGGPVEFHLPLLFVKSETAAKDVGTITTRYKDSTDAGTARRHVVLGGQLVAYAARTDNGDAVLESGSILVCGDVDPGQPPFRPKLEAANVRVPAVNSAHRQQRCVDY